MKRRGKVEGERCLGWGISIDFVLRQWGTMGGFRAQQGHSPVYAFFLIVIKVAQHKSYRFKMFNSIAFSIFTMLYNHHLCLIPKHFITPKGSTMPIKLLPVSLSAQALVNH